MQFIYILAIFKLFYGQLNHKRTELLKIFSQLKYSSSLGLGTHLLTIIMTKELILSPTWVTSFLIAPLHNFQPGLF